MSYFKNVPGASRRTTFAFEGKLNKRFVRVMKEPTADPGKTVQIHLHGRYSSSGLKGVVQDRSSQIGPGDGRATPSDTPSASATADADRADEAPDEAQDEAPDEAQDEAPDEAQDGKLQCEERRVDEGQAKPQQSEEGRPKEPFAVEEQAEERRSGVPTEEDASEQSCIAHDVIDLMHDVINPEVESAPEKERLVITLELKDALVRRWVEHCISVAS
jgi:septal ring-binding cell division protein DamX